MATLVLKYDNDTELCINYEKGDFETQEEQQEYIDDCIETHLRDNPGIKEVSRMFVGGDNFYTPGEEGEVEVQEEVLEPDWDKPSEETVTADHKYMVTKINSLREVHTTFTVKRDGNEVFKIGTEETGLPYKKCLEEAEAVKEEGDELIIDEYTNSPLKDMSKEAFVDYYNRLDFERSLFVIKHGEIDTGVVIDEEIEHADEEKVVNLIGNLPRPLFATYNQERNRWECMLPMRDCLVVILARTQANALLRALFTLRTGTLYNNYDILDKVVTAWKLLNETNEDPLNDNKEYLDSLARAAGTTLADIDGEYEEMVKKANGLA